MLIHHLLLHRRKHSAKPEVKTSQTENSPVMTAPDLSFSSSPAVQTKSEQDHPYLLALLLVLLVGMPLAWLLRSPEPTVSSDALPLEAGLTSALPLSQRQVNRAERVIASPVGWQAVQVKSGITAYVAPAADVPIAQTNSSSGSAGGSAGFAGDGFDGTRHPYLSEVSFADLKAVAPGRYVWSGVWEGEGYDRVLDSQGQLVSADSSNSRGQLVSPREGGSDIHLNLVWDATITDTSRPNLTITVQSNQDQTAQLTNFSAFLNDPNSGETLERKDLGQLPPVYQVTLNSSGRLISESSKTLQPLGTVAFAYHIPPAELKQHLPITLEAVNKLFDQRLAEIAQLEAAGWVVKEVPAPQQSL